MTAVIFLPALFFLLFVAVCWIAAARYLRHRKRQRALIAFLIPLPFMLLIALSPTDEAILLRLTLFHFWFLPH